MVKKEKEKGKEKSAQSSYYEGKERLYDICNKK